jgi:hypothetical protein
MSDDDLIRRGDALNACRASEHRYEAHDAIDALPAVSIQPLLNAAEQRGYANAMEAERKLHEDRIEELERAERQTYRDALELPKQVEALTEQLAAAREDAKEAEAYAEELERGRSVASFWNEAIDEALDILDEEGWLGESRERIELLKKLTGGKDD